MLVNWSKFEEMSRFKSFEIKIPVRSSLEALQALDCWEDPTKLWTHVTPIQKYSPSKHDSTQHWFSFNLITQQGLHFANLICFRFDFDFWVPVVLSTSPCTFWDRAPEASCAEELSNGVSLYIIYIRASFVCCPCTSSMDRSQWTLQAGGLNLSYCTVFPTS